MGRKPNIELKNKKEIQELIDFHYLNLGDIDKLKIENPLNKRTNFEKNNPLIFYLRLMRDPYYFPFFCKHFLNIDLLPFQAVILKELWTHPFPLLVASRGASKSFLLAVYSLIKSFFYRNHNTILVGGSFRQAKLIFDYITGIWDNAPLLRSAVDADKKKSKQGPKNEMDRLSFYLLDSRIMAIPLGTGDKIRGMRGSVIVDEFDSVNPEVYEVVVQGFGAVSPNPVLQVKQMAKRQALLDLGMWSPEQEQEFTESRKFNQNIISGTAGYIWDHFSQYHDKWEKIITSKGDVNKLSEIFKGVDNIPLGFDWRDYCILHLPYDLLPPGFMADKTLALAKASLTSDQFLREYNAVFLKDTSGFFPMKLINSCVVKTPLHISATDETVLPFHALTRGNITKEYVYGIDPAMYKDNLAITIIELEGKHRKIVYTWTINKKDHEKLLKNELVTETDFYGFVARKIRCLTRVFPPVIIGIDTQGGGYALEEALHENARLVGDELPYWRIINPDKTQATDNKLGPHILEMVEFSNYNWVTTANYGMKKDFEDKVLLFPIFDEVEIAEMTLKEFENENPYYDNSENIMWQIEELKEELASIIITKTSNAGRDQWGTPDIKNQDTKKGYQRKDRYSALLISNMCARSVQNTLTVPVQYLPPSSGSAKEMAKVSVKNMGPSYSGPAWFAAGMDNFLNKYYG